MRLVPGLLLLMGWQHCDGLRLDIGPTMVTTPRRGI